MLDLLRYMQFSSQNCFIKPEWSKIGKIIFIRKMNFFPSTTDVKMFFSLVFAIKLKFTKLFILCLISTKKISKPPMWNMVEHIIIIMEISFHANKKNNKKIIIGEGNRMNRNLILNSLFIKLLLLVITKHSWASNNPLSNTYHSNFKELLTTEWKFFDLSVFIYMLRNL